MCNSQEDSAAAGAPEIEVTAEMIEAGVSAFYAHDPRIDDIGEILPDVFRAMTKAKIGAPVSR